MRIETAIAEYALIDLVPAEAAVVTAAPGVPAIGEKVRGAAVERVPLRPCILLQVGVLMAGEVLIGGGVVARARMVQE